MKLAVIDIGSNAIRLQIVKAFYSNELVSFKKLEFLRFPLRLGHDVFQDGGISVPVLNKFVKLMTTFKLLMDLYEVEGHRAVATSAMREATNGNDVRQFILDQVGLNIEIIPGDEEANILNKAIIPYLTKSKHIHIDVGGGSTEINIFDKKKLIKSQSFNIGSVRQLSPESRIKVIESINSSLAEVKIKANETVRGIGTGGNINKIYGIANKGKGRPISLAELKALKAYIAAFSLEERMNILKMNPDRADVIIPASEIYINALQAIGADSILVPKVGLKDGLVYELYEKVSGKDLAEIEFLG